MSEEHEEQTISQFVALGAGEMAVRSKYSADIETLSEHDFRGRNPHESQATFGGIEEVSFGSPTTRTWGSVSSTHAFAEMCQITTV